MNNYNFHDFKVGTGSAFREGMQEGQVGLCTRRSLGGDELDLVEAWLGSRWRRVGTKTRTAMSRPSAQKTSLKGFWALLIVAVGLCGLAGSAMATESGPVERFAVIVGTNDGGEERVVLRYAETDALKFAAVLQELGGVEAENALVLLGAGVEEIEKAFGVIQEQISTIPSGTRVEVVFYYSGHSDEQGLRLHEQLLSYKELRDGFDEVAADVHIIVLDSCAAGALTRSKGGARRAAFLVDEAVEVTGHAFLTSSSEDEVAQESDTLGGSFFTHYLVTGMRGVADISADQKITLNEAYQYAFAETLRRTESTQGGAQHPVYEIQLTGTGDLVLTDLRNTSATLKIDPELQGRVFVHDTEGELVAEMSSSEEREINLGVAPGLYSLRVLSDKDLLESEVKLEKGDTLHLRRGDFLMKDKELALARGPRILGQESEHVEVQAEQDLLLNDEHQSSSVGEGEVELFIGADVIPGIGSSLIYGMDTIRDFSINFIGGSSSGVNFAEFSLIYNTTGKYVHGLQLSMAANVNRGEAEAVLLTMGVNYVREHLAGFAASMGANVVGGEAEAGLITMGANVVGGEMDGVVASLGANVVGASLDGVAVSLGANVIAGSAEGVLLSSGVNYVDEEMDGVMVGMANLVGGEVDGLMIGLINFADNSDLPLGLINIMTEGRSQIDLWQEGRYTSAAFRHGGNYFHYLYGTAYDFTRDDIVPGVCFGIGGHFPFNESFALNLDLYNTVFIDEEEEEISENVKKIEVNVDQLSTLRLSLEFNPFEHFGLFGGVGYSLVFSRDVESKFFDSVDWQREFFSSGADVGGYVSLHGGVSLLF